MLLLQQYPDRSWTAADVADALRLLERRAAQQLEILGGRHLFDVRIGVDVRYRYSPATPDLGAIVKQVADSYRENRAATVAFVSGRGRRSLRDFADAFRIKREKDDA